MSDEDVPLTQKACDIGGDLCEDNLPPTQICIRGPRFLSASDGVVTPIVNGTSVGRVLTCSIKLIDSNLRENPRVSSRHGSFTINQDGCFFTDTSTNGTTLKRADTTWNISKGEMRLLKNEDELSFGDSTKAERYDVFRFRIIGLDETTNEDIRCVSCPSWFLFTEGEQQFFATRGFSRPKLCKTCKEQRAEEKNTKPTVYKSSRQQGKHKHKRGKQINSCGGAKK